MKITRYKKDAASLAGKVPTHDRIGFLARRYGEIARLLNIQKVYISELEA